MRPALPRSLATRPGRFAAFLVGPDDPLADAGRSVERIVFETAFGLDADTMKAEYSGYDAVSRFIVVLDRVRDRPAGVIRLIDESSAGLKTLNDAPAHIGGTVDDIRAHHRMTDGRRAVDVATLAVLPEYRGARSVLVSTLLYRTLYRAFHRDGITHVVAMIDEPAYRNLRRIGTPFVPMLGSSPFTYLGSAENRALYGDFREFGPAITRNAALLREQARVTPASLRSPRRLLRRRVAARIATTIITGEGLDRQIHL
ncbi:GNAT superfamily N-acetyltransferase [Catenuloplanes nepalensis]|uniref:GNAT superfamily N-acetyltransferase n=1 Tax=Catenuloplanes nepalensis TaxID=587533 RepID=A0ABT9N4D8_9ACTN|nr:hypothetical protein [Catenuloplanes nepalensis]MDP9798420.1 GNAT superfamily N-acetyltransferase [Catenuloplanes nepalensis]